MDINVCRHARAHTHTHTHTHTHSTVSFSSIRLYWVKLFINSFECRMSFATTKSIEHFEKKKKKKNTKGFVKHPVPKLCLLVKIYEAHNGRNDTHYPGRWHWFVKIKLLYKCSCTFIVEQKSFPYQTNGINKSKYSWLSLSRTRLSRITAYLEVKIWSLPKHENLTTGKKYCGKEEKLLLRSNFSSFFTIFSIYLTSWVQLHINLLNVVIRIIFSSILQIWYVEVRISRSISESPLEFEITRVDCNSWFTTSWKLKLGE